jgi:hypothetical protein
MKSASVRKDEDTSATTRNHFINLLETATAGHSQENRARQQRRDPGRNRYSNTGATYSCGPHLPKYQPGRKRLRGMSIRALRIHHGGHSESYTATREAAFRTHIEVLSETDIRARFACFK